jgi:hypothetical protein
MNLSVDRRPGLRRVVRRHGSILLPVCNNTDEREYLMQTSWRQSDPIVAQKDRTASWQLKVTVWIACLVIMAIRTAALIRHSYQYGRLSGPPVYDDVTYFHDAMSRLQFAYRDGLGRLIHDMVVTPPHAPWSTTAAMLGFSLSGGELYAPYVVNAVAVWILLASVVTILPLPATAAICIFVVASLTPLVDWTITTFHPDMVMGLAVATTCTHLIFNTRVTTSLWRTILLGVLGAGCMLSKPTAFPAIVALLGFAGALSLVHELLVPSSDQPVRRRVVARLRFVSLVLVIAAIGFMPYAVMAWHDLTSYIYMVMWGKRDVFALNLDLRDYLLYYPRMDMTLMASAGVAMAVVAGAYLLLMLVRFSRFGFVSLLCAAAMVLANYAILLSAKAQTPFFGGILYWSTAITLIVGVCFMVVTLLDYGYRRMVVALFSTLLVYTLATYVDGQQRMDPTYQFATSSILRQVDDVIGDDQRMRGVLPGTGTTFLLVVYPYPLPDRAYLLRGLQRGYQQESLGDGLWINTDIGYWVVLASHATYIIVPDDKIVTAYPLPLPITKMMPSIRSYLETSPQYRVMKDVATPAGHVLIYVPVLSKG